MAPTPKERQAEPAAGALPPMPTVGVTAERLNDTDAPGDRPPASDPVEEAIDPHVTSTSTRTRRLVAPLTAALAVVLVTLLAATLAFRQAGDSPPDITGLQAESVELNEFVATSSGNELLLFDIPALVSEGTATSDPVWEVTVEAPRVATDEARAHRSENEPERNHVFLAVSVEIKLVASASGEEFPPTDWLIEGDSLSANIDLPSIPDIDTCSLPENFVSLPLKVGESMRGTFCAEVHLLDIPETTAVRLTLDGQRFRFG